MITRSSATLALCILGMAPSPAQATWNGTQWGMSVDQVIATIGESASKVRDERDKRILNTHRLVTSHDTREDLHYTVDYFFTPRDKRLTKVNLKPEPAECPIARAAFAVTLGEGDQQEKRIEIAPDRPAIIEFKQVWQDPAGQGTVSYLSVSFDSDLRFCQILFEE